MVLAWPKPSLLGFSRFTFFAKKKIFGNREISTFSKGRPGFDPKIEISVIFCSGKPVSKVEKSKITKNQKLKFFDPGLGPASKCLAHIADQSNIDIS